MAAEKILPDLHIKINYQLDGAHVEKTIKLLQEYENSFIDSESKIVQLFARDEQHKIYGSLIGTIKWDALKISDFWVDEHFRKRGIGMELLLNAEKWALENTCSFILVETMSFYNHTIYIKAGFKEVFRMDDYPKGFTYFFYKKILTNL